MKVYEKKLCNGLHCVGISNKSNIFGIVVRISFGSKYESNSKMYGIAHFIEHMMFKGTNRRTQKEISEEVEGSGGEMNAYTTRNFTMYYMSGISESSDVFVDVIQDMISDTIFNEKDFDLEKKVILEEINSDNDSFEVLAYYMFTAYLYGNHSLGIPIAGTIKTVSNSTIEYLREVKRDIYHSKNMQILICGDINRKTFDRYTKKFLSISSEGKESKYKNISREIPFGKDKSIRRSTWSQNYIFIFGPGPKRFSREFIVAKVLNSILGGGISSRLYQRIREELGLVYSISSRVCSHEDHGMFIINCATGVDKESDSNSRCITETKEIIRDIYKNGVTGISVDSAKKSLLGQIAHHMETSTGACEYVSDYFERNGSIKNINDINDEIKRVDLKEVQDLIKKYFNEDSWGVFAAGPSF
ncbi:MAG: insulinase family protein [Chlamydiia bacterium]|nr:insulinase family protein [Chlamydiia bacterium]